MIKEVVEKIKKDGTVKDEIERIKGHEWVRVVEGKNAGDYCGSCLKEGKNDDNK